MKCFKQNINIVAIFHPEKKEEK